MYRARGGTETYECICVFLSKVTKRRERKVTGYFSFACSLFCNYSSYLRPKIQGSVSCRPPTGQAGKFGGEKSQAHVHPSPLTISLSYPPTITRDVYLLFVMRPCTGSAAHPTVLPQGQNAIELAVSVMAQPALHLSRGSRTRQRQQRRRRQP